MRNSREVPPDRFEADTAFFKGFYRAGRSDEEVRRATELDWFGRRALEGFLRRFSGREARVLEAGVGSGRFSVALSGRFPATRFVGLDIVPELSENMKRGAGLRRRMNLDGVVGDITRLPFTDGSFDLVFNQGVVEHTGGRHGEAVAEMARVTRRGGVVIVTVPNFYCFPHTLRRALRRRLGLPLLTGDEPPFRHREMRRCFREAGLESVEIEGYYFMQSIMRIPTFSCLNRHPLALKAGNFLLHDGGRLVERFLVPVIDRLTRGGFSNRFGFEIMVSGVKP